MSRGLIDHLRYPVLFSVRCIDKNEKGKATETYVFFPMYILHPKQLSIRHTTREEYKNVYKKSYWCRWNKITQLNS